MDGEVFPPPEETCWPAETSPLCHFRGGGFISLTLSGLSSRVLGGGRENTFALVLDNLVPL